MDLSTGSVVSDRYTIEGVLGEGGMAVVYRARHNQLGTLHALKVLTITSRAIRERLLQEGRVQAALRHPNIVAVTDVVDIQGAPGLVMELVEGPSLDELVRQQKLTIDQVDVIGRGIISGVAHAHQRGLIHRDLKPANVMLQLTAEGVVPKVTDFGLAKILAGTSDGARPATRTGSTMGTPQYMSPEQIQDSKNVDARSDVFALGSILYELLTGVRAFDGDNILAIFSAVARVQYTDPRSHRHDAPERMLEAIERAIVADPADRLQSCSALFETWTDGEALPAQSFTSADLRAIAGTTSSPPSGEVAQGAAESPSADTLFEAVSEERAPGEARSMAPTVLVGGGVLAAGGGVIALLLLVIGGLGWMLWQQRDPVVLHQPVYLEGTTPEGTPPDGGAPAAVPVEAAPPVVEGPSPEPVDAPPEPVDVPSLDDLLSEDPDTVPDAAGDPGTPTEHGVAAGEEAVDGEAIVDPPAPEEPVSPDLPEPAQPEAPAPPGLPASRVYAKPALPAWDQVPSSMRNGGATRIGSIQGYRGDAAASPPLATLVLRTSEPLDVREAALETLMHNWLNLAAEHDVGLYVATWAMKNGSTAMRIRALRSWSRRGDSIQPPLDLLGDRGLPTSVRVNAVKTLGAVGPRIGAGGDVRAELSRRAAVESDRRVQRAMRDVVERL